MNFTFLTKEQCFGDENGEGQLDIIKTRKAGALLTDFAIALGGEPKTGKITRPGLPLNHYTPSDSLGMYWTKSATDNKRVLAVDTKGGKCNDSYTYKKPSFIGGRPALHFSEDDSIYTDGKIKRNAIGDGGIMRIEYGFYPQQAVNKKMQEKLWEKLANDNLQLTGNTYTIVKARARGDADVLKIPEYEYNRKRYIRVENRSYCPRGTVKLSNGEAYKDGDNIWIEVSPVEWLVDKEASVMVANKILFAGVEFDKNDKDYHTEDFDNTSIKKFMDEHFAKDLVQDLDREYETKLKENGDDSMELEENEVDEVKADVETETEAKESEINDEELQDLVGRVAKDELTKEELNIVSNNQEYVNNRKTIRKLTSQLGELTDVEQKRKIIHAQEILIAELQEQIKERKEKLAGNKEADLPESTL